MNIPSPSTPRHPNGPWTQRAKGTRHISYFKVAVAGCVLMAVILPWVGLFYLRNWYADKLHAMAQATIIVVNKNDMKLRLYSFEGELKLEYPIACGATYGNKEKQGDKRTPEGVFQVGVIENAKNWEHDFGDGLGPIRGAYGPYFIRLMVPGQQGIGIHGTHLPGSIGSRTTEGCIRLQNDHLQTLVPYVHPGTVVVITPSSEDVKPAAKTSPKENLTKTN